MSIVLAWSASRASGRNPQSEWATSESCMNPAHVVPTLLTTFLAIFRTTSSSLLPFRALHRSNAPRSTAPIFPNSCPRMNTSARVC
ncbi:hypothetical protein C0991_003219, partial [Blastosporella zonata]